MRLWSVATEFLSNLYEKAMNAIPDHIRRSTLTAKGNLISGGPYLIV